MFEFVGENVIDYMLKDEMVCVYIGNVFDFVGECKQMNYCVDNNCDEFFELFEIELCNCKEELVEVIVVEYFYCWVNWEIQDVIDVYEKIDVCMVEFKVQFVLGEEKKIIYMVCYSWQVCICV